MKPVSIHAARAYKYNAGLEAAMKFDSNFEDPYNISTRRGDELWIPRGLRPTEIPLKNEMTRGWEVKFQNNFRPIHVEQSSIYQRGVELLRMGAGFVLNAPTGYGKTIMGCAYAAAMQRRTLVIVTKDDLIKQWRTSAKLILGISDKQMGVWRGDLVPGDEPFVVGLVQSLRLGTERYPDVDWGSFGLVLCDEVHRMAADKFSQTMWSLPGELRVGLSATTTRSDGKAHVFKAHIGSVTLVAKQETLLPTVVLKRTGWKVPEVYWYGKKQKLP